MKREKICRTDQQDEAENVPEEKTSSVVVEDDTEEGKTE